MSATLTIGARLLGLSGEPIVLASLSPRRRSLLRMLGLHYETLAPEVEEGGWTSAEAPESYVQRMALAKALWVPAKIPGYAVLAADTVVYHDAQVLEKPNGRDHARSLLRTLSGREHQVYTGICLRRLRDERLVSGYECSHVRFSRLDEPVIETYLDTGEPMDKAGAYGIQGFGGLLIEKIEGCYFNVMGLPLHRLRGLVAELERG